MKKIPMLLAFLILTSCSKAPIQEVSIQQAPVQKSWLENTHYKVLNQQVTETPQVTELFSFWCGHCYNFEPIAAKIKAQLDSNTEFKKVHVDFMGFTTQAAQQSASKAMLMARHMGKEDLINAAIFEHIHINKKSIGGMADIKPLFLANQISAEDFDTAMALSEIDNLIEEHYKTFMLYRADTTSVPTLIVNGRYKAQFTQDMDVNDMVNLIVWLTKRP
ncbi:MAG: thiol:disulfide interchange protein DsbA [Gammaproteobacteria bacterium]|jgi:thiol:disulfide interchange protein DsbA